MGTTLMVIRFYKDIRRYNTLPSHYIREYAVDEGGNMAPMMPHGIVPDADAFVPGEMVLFGVAGLGPDIARGGNRQHKAELALEKRYNRGVILYTFLQMTPELIASLDFKERYEQPYTIATVDIKEATFIWNRGIEKIYFPS